jgi:uncharacterized membrane protein YbhN (UPF0104 family)
MSSTASQQCQPTRANRLDSAGPFFKAAKWLVLVLLLGAFGAYFWLNQTEFQRLLDLSGTTLLQVVIGRAIAYLALISATIYCLGRYAPNLNSLEFMAASSAGTLVSLPGAVQATKSVYLKGRHGLEIQKSLAISGVIVAVALGMASLAALIGLAWLQMQGKANLHLLWLLGVLTLFGASFILVFAGRLPKTGRLQRFAYFPETWAEVVRDRRRLLTVAALLGVRSLSSFFAFGLLFAALANVPNGLVVGGVVDALTFALRLVMITPGNLGVYEWVVAILSSSVGSTLATGLACAAVYRAAGLLVTGSAGLISVLLLGSSRTYRKESVK